jgi:hypothetical protein
MLAHALRHVSAPSLAGRDLPERLRSVSVGLVGLVAAAGLSLVALASNAGIPEALWSPLPEIPRAHVGEAQSLAPRARAHASTSSTVGSGSAASVSATGTRHATPASWTASGDDVGPGSRHSSSLADGHSGGVSPGTHSPAHAPPAGHGTAGDPAPTPPPATGPPAAKPPVTETPSTPPPVVSPPAEEAPAPEASAPGNGKGKAKGHEKPSHSEAPPPPVEEPEEESSPPHGKGRGAED